MKKKTNVRPLQQVVRAKKRGGSGLPGAAQRARSRQRGATLEAEYELTLKAFWNSACGSREEKVAVKKLDQLEDDIATQRRRRPFGANEKLCHGAGKAGKLPT